MRNDIAGSETQIRQFISENQSKAYISRYFHCKPETLERHLCTMGIKYGGNQGGKGIKADPKRKNALQLIADMNAGRSAIKTDRLRKRLIEDGIKEHKCEICHLSEWRGSPIPLELHHVNGNRFDSRLSNLLLLCPNCHAREPNNSGKAVGNYNKL